MKTITVDVTAEDIAEGRISDCQNCPVASAISRLVANPVSVIPDNVLFFGMTQWNGPDTADFPAEVTRWIRAFDGQEDVRPITFSLEIPDWVQLKPTS